MGSLRIPTLIAIVLLGATLLGAAPPVASVALPEAPASIWDRPGMLEFAGELRASATTPEELADIEAAFAWLEAHPEALDEARRLVDGETPPTRERGDEVPKEDGGFDLMRTDDRTKPVLIVHGRDNYNMNGFSALRSYLQGAGFSNVRRIGYYGGECNVEHTAEHHGSHANWYGGSGEHSSKTGCNGVAGAQVHDLDTDIMHIAYHFAWMVHDHYGASGVTVDAVGHSMGGLLMRYAIAKSGSGGVWPPKLRVEDATTIGTPHGGLGTSWCKWSPWADVRQMCSDNYFITWMKSNAQNPQGNGGTDWTLMGSDCDGWVAWNLAVDMQAAHKVVYVSPCYGHSDYYGDVSATNDADVDYMDAPATTWTAWGSAPHAGKWVNYASTYGSW
jgi:hypothetical protein